MDLLTETIKALQAAGKSPSRVRWVGSRDGTYAIDWDAFEAFASSLTYQRFSGQDIIARDLVVVGDNWWMDRVVVDGVQLWDLKEYPRRRGRGLNFSNVVAKRGSPAVLRRLNPKWGADAESELEA